MEGAVYELYPDECRHDGKGLWRKLGGPAQIEGDQRRKQAGDDQQQVCGEVPGAGNSPKHGTHERDEPDTDGDILKGHRRLLVLTLRDGRAALTDTVRDGTPDRRATKIGV
jgi:hypothetical protein